MSGMQDVTIWAMKDVGKLNGLNDSLYLSMCLAIYQGVSET